MATFSKRGDKHLVQVCVKGRRTSKVCDTKNEARAWALAEEHKLSNSTTILEGKTLTDAFQRYAREESIKKKGVRWEMIRLEKLQRDPIASILLTSINADDFDDWIKRGKDAGLANSTILRELKLIGPVLTIARKRWRWMEGNPLENVDLPKAPPPRKKLISNDEITNILAALEYEEDKPIMTTKQKIAFTFLFAIETAMRQGEIFKMEWPHINWKECSVYLSDTKNGDDREVPLSKRAIQLLRKMNPADQGKVLTDLTQGNLASVFRYATEVAGYKGTITFHDTRHLAITRMAEKLDMLALSSVTGHKDPRMLRTYFNPTTKSLADRLG